MKKYFLFFKLRFATGLQYRMASVTALTTQVLWGLMECLAYKAIAEAMGENLPMDYPAIVSYIWLKEAFFAFFNTWAADNEIFSLIRDGGVAYELCRPVSVYSMWFSRIVGGRASEAALRCIPVLLCASLMPNPYRLGLPVSGAAFGLFLITMVLGMGITVAFCMLIYMLCFFTISPQGWRMVFLGAVDLFTGGIIPLPFFPEKFLKVVELLPFAYMQNVPFRIYCGDMAGDAILPAIMMQGFWCIVLLALGRFVWTRVEKTIIVQGG